MTNLNNQPGALPPQQRPLTGPAAPAVQPGAYQPQPGAYQPLPADQNAVAPGLARDPQVLAAISIYSLQLGSQNPIEVSSAIAAIESFGPAYRAELVSALSNQVMAGQNPMRSLIVMDALVRHNATEASGKLMGLLNDSDPNVRTEASKAFSKLKGVAAPGAAPAALPGVPGAPGAAPGMTPQGTPTAPGQVPPELAHLVERMRDWQQMGAAAVEIAQLPTEQMAAVAAAVFKGPHIENERAYDLLAAVVSKRVPQPGTIDAMRALLSVPENPSQTEFMMKAKLRAATTLIHFGDQRDYPGIVKLVLDKYDMTSAMKKILIDQIASKPALLAFPGTTPALVAVLSTSDNSMIMVPAANALSKIKNAQARDALGESPFLQPNSVFGSERTRWTLDWLAQHPPPYSGRTVENLRKLAQSKEKAIADKAKELLKKTGA